MYELYDPCTTMFFFRNKHIMVDLGTGNNNKINWALDDKQEMIDLVEVKKMAMMMGFYLQSKN
jgi:DIM1 family U5 snRNP protein